MLKSGSVLRCSAEPCLQAEISGHNLLLRGVFHMVFLSAKKCCVFKKACLFYYHYNRKVPVSKPVQNYKKTPENQGFRWPELSASKTVVFGGAIIYTLKAMSVVSQREIQIIWIYNEANSS